MALFEKIHTVEKLTQLKGGIPLEYHYTAGPGLDPFLSGLKDGKLIGSICPTCEETYFPSRLFCEICFSEHTESEEIKNQGEVESYTTVFEDLNGNPISNPETFAMIRFPKIKGGLVHRLRVPKNKLDIGVKVKAIFAQPKDRKGKITDIVGFEPVV